MIFWLVLFLFVVLISFLLAWRSMKDFQETPKGSNVEYSLYLVRNISNLTHELLNRINEQIKTAGLTLSLERLVKGNQTVLSIFGPKKILQDYITPLNLLELEDYTNIDTEHVAVWEITLRQKQVAFNIKDLLADLRLNPQEQLWWQVLLQPSKEVGLFQFQIRVVAISLDAQRRKHILERFQKSEHVNKLPKPFSNNQLFEFFKNRSLMLEINNPKLKSDEVLRLVK